MAEQARASNVEGMEKTIYRYGTIGKVVGVISGKGGVGKSAVTAMLAASMAHQGKKVGILDADITGPSIPHMFGLNQKAHSLDHIILPVESVEKIKIMSINLILENEADPVIWRGPLLGGVVKQFFGDVAWDDLDYLFVDLPPGTGDVPLTVMQSLPLDGVVVVTTPQDLVGMIVKKAIHMAEKLGVPVLGLIGNMSYIECPDCNKRIHLFGGNGLQAMAEETGIPLLASLPMMPDLAVLADEGKIELVDHLYPDFFMPVAKRLQDILEKE